jgi:cysteine desulfuration protein SufE
MTSNLSKIKELTLEIQRLEDWEDKYETLIEIGKFIPDLNEVKKPELLVKGCSSKVWLKVEIQKDNQLNLIATSDSLTVKGIIGILKSFLQGQKPGFVLAFEMTDLDHLNLSKNLSSNRLNGLSSILEKIKSDLKKLLS